MITRLFLFISIYCFSCMALDAQDPLRFKEEVKELTSGSDAINGRDTYVFTGSSSVKYWKTLNSDFADFPVLNRGFGGSTMSDLLHYQDELIFKYNPSKVFIYEGDNDISMEKPVDVILEEAQTLVANIKKRLPEAKIYFISPKPSIARWALREQYKQFNYSLSAWTSFEDNVHFIDVWTPMCDENGEVLSDIFVDDNLHMNAKGYVIWAKAIRSFVEEK